MRVALVFVIVVLGINSRALGQIPLLSHLEGFPFDPGWENVGDPELYRGGLAGLFGSWVNGEGEAPYPTTEVVITYQPIYWTPTPATSILKEIDENEGGGATWAQIKGNVGTDFSFIGAAHGSNFNGDGQVKANANETGQVVLTYEALPAGLPQTPNRKASVIDGMMFAESSAGAFGEPGTAKCGAYLRFNCSIFGTKSVLTASHKNNDSGVSAYGFAVGPLSIPIPSGNSSDGYSAPTYDQEILAGSTRLIGCTFDLKSQATLSLEVDDDAIFDTANAYIHGWGAVLVEFLLEK